MRPVSTRRRLLAVMATLSIVLFGGSVGDTPQSTRARDRESPAEAAARLQQQMGGDVTIHLAEATGVAKFVRAGDDVALPTGDGTLRDKAYGFLTEYGSLFGVDAPRQELTVTRIDSDPAGSTVRLAQRHGSLPVFNAELLVNFDSGGRITAVSGTFVPGLKTPGRATIPAADAAGKARRAVAQRSEVGANRLTASVPRLGLTMTGLAADEPGRQALVWSTTVRGAGLRNFVFTDAIAGGVVQIFEGIHNELRRENYNMLEQSDYDLAVKCRFEGEPPSGDPDCDNAYTFTGDTYNFFYNGFRRDGFDNRGTTLKSYVHYLSSICPNAFWNGSVMTYCTNGPHDDVTGHEISHGVTEFSANLVYAYQPGALNESFSDIFGESIDQLNSSENTQRWVIGEDFIPGGIRDMSDPTRFGDPDSCTSPNYHCASSDSGGVHINSGVPNKAYYLMVDGGTHNGITVTGIGLNKAAAIQYRALTRYLSVFSDFTDAYLALQSSCRDLRNKYVNNADPETGGGRAQKVTNADCTQVKKALDAVQLTAPVCTDVAPAPAGPLCNSGETVARLFHDDHETGSPGWSASLNEALYTGQQWQVVSDFTASGTHAWRVNDELTDCSSGDWTSDVYLVSPNVNVAGTNRPVLRFLHDFFTEGGYDGGSIEINLNGAWTKLEQADFTLNAYNGQMNLDSTAPNWTPTSRQVFTGYRTPGNFPDLTYAESRVNLTNYVARDTDKTVSFRFRFGTDFCNGTDVGWYLDDVEVYDCKL